MNNKIIDAQKQVYRSSFIEHGDTPKGTHQNDQITQDIRYSSVLKHLLFYKSENFSIHDVGSGLCDMHRYLIEKNIKHSYSGTEIVEEMNEVCRKKYPEIKLFNRDFLNISLDEKYDFITCCGTLYIPGNVDHASWKMFFFDLIQKMFDQCTVGISFNFLTTHVTFMNPDLFYISPSEVIDFCIKNLSRFVIADHAFPLYESSVTVYKKEFLKSVYSQEALQKYFRT